MGLAAAKTALFARMPPNSSRPWRLGAAGRQQEVDADPASYLSRGCPNKKIGYSANASGKSASSAAFIGHTTVKFMFQRGSTAEAMRGGDSLHSLATQEFGLHLEAVANMSRTPRRPLPDLRWTVGAAS